MGIPPLLFRYNHNNHIIAIYAKKCDEIFMNCETYLHIRAKNAARIGRRGGVWGLWIFVSGR
jgi:hypothetical protein